LGAHSRDRLANPPHGFVAHLSRIVHHGLGGALDPGQNKTPANGGERRMLPIGALSVSRSVSRPLLRRQLIKLPSGGSEGILDRGVRMFVPPIVSLRVIDNDIFVGRHGEPDVNLESGAVAVLVAWRNHLDATSGNAVIVCFQSLDLIDDLCACRIRCFRTFESDFRGDLHCVSLAFPWKFPCR
jgi:hypothetical protein